VLRDREKRVVTLGGAAAAALLVLTFIVFPGVSRLKSLARASAAAEKDLAAVRQARPELERIQRDTVQRANVVRAAANRKEAPLVRISNTLLDAGIPQSAFSVKSGGTRDGESFREESFDVRLENLTYLEAVKALQKLAGPDQPMVVRSALLKSRYDDPRYLDATLRVGYLSPKP
jgi:general secretion pathway protein M